MPPIEEDDSYVKMAEGGFETAMPVGHKKSETAQDYSASVESTTQHTEVMEGIAREEQRLSDNVAESATVLKTVEAKFDDPTAREKGAELKWEVNLLRITEAYDKAKAKIDELSRWGYVGATGLLASAVIPSMHAESLKSSMDALSSFEAVQQSYDMAAGLAEGGIATAAVVAGIWAIARYMNSLRRRSKENENWQERKQGVNLQST